MRLNILIVSRYFYPEITPRAFRTYELASEFARRGHSVKVMIPSISEDAKRFAEKNNISLLSYGPLKWKSIIIKGNKLSTLIRRVVFRLTNLLFDYPDIESRFRIPEKFPYSEQIDLLLSIAAPHSVHWGVGKAFWKIKTNNTCWIADCGDPFMGQDNDTFKHPFYFKSIEYAWCRLASFITIPTIKSLNAYYTDFHHKIRIVPQGFKFPELNNSSEVNIDSKIRFAYAGSFIPVMRDPSMLFEELMKLNSVDFEFHVFTNSLALINQYKDALGKKLVIQDLVPRHILLQELKSFDFLINFMNVGEKQVPSKLIDYAIIGKPIFNIERNTVNANLLEAFLNRDYSGSFVVENVDQYRIENVCQQMLDLYNISKLNSDVSAV
jgi:hypothetical protein